MEGIAKFMENLPSAWKAVSALAGAAAVGFSFAIIFGGWTEIPAAVESNTEAIEDLAIAVRANTLTIERHIARPMHDGAVKADSILGAEFRSQNRQLICILTLDESVPAREALTRCPLGR